MNAEDVTSILRVMPVVGAIISTFPGSAGVMLYVTNELEVAHDAFNRRVFVL